MPKVLRIINRFNVGGPTYNAAYLSKFLPEDFEVKLIGGTPAPGEAHSGYMLDQIGVTYQEIPEMSRSINPFQDIKAFFRIRKIIREFQPDIVHTHAAKAGALGRIAAWMAGVPVIVHTYHGHVFSNYFSGWKSRLVRFVEKQLGKISTHIIVISEKQFDEIIGEFKIVPPSKAYIVPLGFDLNRFKENKESKREAFRNLWKTNDAIAIGIIGRFAPVKNHPLFFESLHVLKKIRSDWKAFIIGDGELKQTYIESLSSFKVSETPNPDAQIIFTSWIKDIDVALAGLDIIVLTSLNEGTPVSLIEAQAAGKPVLSTRVGGVENCITPNESGYIVDSNAEAFAEKLSLLIDEEDRRQEMGSIGEDLVMSKYHYVRLCEDIAKLYRAALTQHSGRL